MGSLRRRVSTHVPVACGGRSVEIGLVLDDRRDDVSDRVARKGGRARQHLEEHATEGPDVGALVDRAAACLFGRHAGRRAEDDAGMERRAGDVIVGEFIGLARPRAESTALARPKSRP